MQSVEARVVQRAAVEVLQPLLDPLFDPRSFGYRPGKGPLRALAAAEALYAARGLGAWVSADIRGAFPGVPVGRLPAVVRKYLPDGGLAAFVETLARPDRVPGLRRGGPLSPLRLNLYLHHTLDRPWRKKNSGVPLLRFADDILLLCGTPGQAGDAHGELVALLRPAGFELKGDAVKLVSAGESADWMGFRIRRDRAARGGPRYAVTPDAWGGLAEMFAAAHGKPHSPLAAAATLAGWVGGRGPCYPHTNPDRAYRRVRALAGAQGFDEIPCRSEVQGLWQRACARWRKLSRKAAAPEGGDAGVSIPRGRVMGGGRLREYCSDLCDYAVSHFRGELRPPRESPVADPGPDHRGWSRLRPAEWAARAVAGLPTPLADHVWAGVRGDKVEALLADADLDALASAAFHPPPRVERDCAWVPYPALHRRAVECVPETRFALARQAAEDWVAASAGFAARLCEESLPLADGVGVVRDWVNHARQLLGLMDEGSRPRPAGRRGGATHPRAGRRAVRSRPVARLRGGPLGPAPPLPGAGPRGVAGQVPVPRTRRDRVAGVAPRRDGPAYRFGFRPGFLGSSGGDVLGTGPGEAGAGVAGLTASTARFGALARQVCGHLYNDIEVGVATQLGDERRVNSVQDRRVSNPFRAR